MAFSYRDPSTFMTNLGSGTGPFLNTAFEGSNDTLIGSTYPMQCIDLVNNDPAFGNSVDLGPDYTKFTLAFWASGFTCLFTYSGFQFDGALSLTTPDDWTILSAFNLGVSPYPDLSTPVWVGLSVDTGAGTISMGVNGVFTPTNDPSGSWDFSHGIIIAGDSGFNPPGSALWGFQRSVIDGSDPPGGQLGDVWFDPGRYVDWSDPANLALFCTPTGEAVFLGDDGSTPFGSPPYAFFSLASGGSTPIPPPIGGGAGPLAVNARAGRNVFSFMLGNGAWPGSGYTAAARGGNLGQVYVPPFCKCAFTAGGTR